MAWATLLKVVSAVIQPMPSTTSSSTASHLGGANTSAAITAALATDASSTRPSASSLPRRGSSSAPRIAPAPTAPSSTP